MKIHMYINIIIYSKQKYNTTVAQTEGMGAVATRRIIYVITGPDS